MKTSDICNASLEKRKMRQTFKTCIACQQTKNKKANFSTNSRSPDGVSDICKDCQQEIRMNKVNKPRNHYRINVGYNNLEECWFGNPDRRKLTTQRKEWFPRIRYTSFVDEAEKNIWRGPNHKNN